MKKRYVLLSKMVALLIALLLLLVPMVAHTSEGDAWVSSGSGLHGMEPDDSGVELQSGNSPPFEIGAPAYEGGELNWDDVATIHICNDGCTHPGICFMCDNPVWGCITCSQGHHGRSQNVYIRGTATGEVTWNIICHGVFPRDEIAISFVYANPNEERPYDRLIIGVHDDLTICRNRIITLEVTRGNDTATVYIVLRACCIGCDTFCLSCEGCFHCTVDPCTCGRGLCEECCCPLIFKSAAPETVSPGDDVVYTIRVTRGDRNREGFGNIEVVDPLNPLLEFVPSSIQVDGAVSFEYYVDGENVLTISDMELYSSAPGVYVRYVVITFTVRVHDDAPQGPIDNTATLFSEGEAGRSASARIEVEYVGEPTTQVEVTKVWVGDTPANRPATVTVELRKIGPEGSELIKTLDLDATGNWQGVFEGLLKYCPQGEDIVYYVKENPVPTGYTSLAVTSLDDELGVWVGVITNTRILDNGGVGGPNGGNNNGQVGGPNGGNGGDPVGGGNGGPLTGDFASTALLLAGLLFAMSGVLGGTSLRRKLKK